MGSIPGVILAAILLTILPEALRAIAQYRMVIYALLLIIIMLGRPQGLFGQKFNWKRMFRKSAAQT
jgi:branched-chain amino acid transport system permease protein